MVQQKKCQSVGSNTEMTFRQRSKQISHSVRSLDCVLPLVRNLGYATGLYEVDVMQICGLNADIRSSLERGRQTTVRCRKRRFSVLSLAIFFGTFRDKANVVI